MDKGKYKQIQSIFVVVRMLYCRKMCERENYESFKNSLQPLYSELKASANENSNEILIYCIDTLFEIINEGDREKIFDFANAIHNMPEICTGARAFETFRTEIVEFRSKYGEQYFPFFSTNDRGTDMIPTEEKEYIAILLKKSEDGDIRAMEEIATYYSQNHPELMNDTIISLVLEYYEKAASAGHQRARLNLGALYYNGIYVTQNYPKAIELYKLALCGNDARIAAIAASNLGYCYYYGRSVDVDYSKAFDYFLEGVLLCNHPVCLYKLGDMYRSGKFVNKDDEKAYFIYCKAKNSSPKFDYEGYADILVRLAEAKIEGIGTDKDIICALKYLERIRRTSDRCSPSQSVLQRAKDLTEKAISICTQGIDKKSYTIRFDTAHIKVLSKIRIPFDNITSNDVLEFKDDLLFAIRTLSVNENSVISARYGTTNAQKQFYDLENVLFYNIGTANFTDLTKNGIMFAETSAYDILRKRNEWGLSEEYEHYYEYMVCSPGKAKNTDLEIACWKDIPFCKCKSLSPLDAWLAMRNADRNIQIKESIECEFGDAFALDLVLEKPKTLEFNITSAMKPLLDGIVSSFHGGLFDEDMISLLVGKLSCTRDQIINVGMNVLGKREYIQKYPRAKNGIKWNPADDMCKSVSIQIIDGDEWRLSGRICKILPRCPKCNKTKVAQIMYGMPAMSEELERQLEEDSVVLAGCCVEGENPRYRCRWCKTEF